MIILPDHHHAEAKRKAAHEGISLSEYIRRLVANDWTKPMPQPTPQACSGCSTAEDRGSPMENRP